MQGGFTRYNRACWFVSRAHIHWFLTIDYFHRMIARPQSCFHLTDLYLHPPPPPSIMPVWSSTFLLSYLKKLPRAAGKITGEESANAAQNIIFLQFSFRTDFRQPNSSYFPTFLIYPFTYFSNLPFQLEAFLILTLFKINSADDVVS